MSVNWHGVLPAITTPFTADLELDHERLGEHCERLLARRLHRRGAPSGSLGEAATLSPDEKSRPWPPASAAVGDAGSVVPGIAALSTAAAVELAQRLAAPAARA